MRSGNLDRELAATAWLIAIACAVAPLLFRSAPIVLEPPFLVAALTWAGLTIYLISRRRWWWMLWSAIPALWALLLFGGVMMLCTVAGCH